MVSRRAAPPEEMEAATAQWSWSTVGGPEEEGGRRRKSTTAVHNRDTPP